MDAQTTSIEPLGAAGQQESRPTRAANVLPCCSATGSPPALWAHERSHPRKACASRHAQNVLPNMQQQVL